MAAPIILRILVTGICAIVPSAKDKDVTRLIAPNAMHVSLTRPKIPQHFAFIEIHSKNYKEEPGGRKPDIRYHLAGDLDTDDRIVFILQSEEIKLETAATNTILTTPSADKPANLGHPTASERNSTFYELKMLEACPKCVNIKNEYFDVFKNPDQVALRMDLQGGRKSTESTNYEKFWTFAGSHVDQPLAQLAVFEYDIPSETERIKLKRAGETDEKTIALVSFDGQSIDVTVGNEPLADILQFDTRKIGTGASSTQHVRIDHFVLIYDMFVSKPKDPPLPELVSQRSLGVRTHGDDCIPPEVGKQDPAP